MLPGNCSRQIRRRRAMPKAIFFDFLFHFPHFHHFTANVTRALPLEVIKGEAGIDRTRRKQQTRQQQLEHITIETAHHNHSRDLGPAPSLESL
jgi:hypothetical protein